LWRLIGLDLLSSSNNYWMIRRSSYLKNQCRPT
jgi:hypothetical protein